MQFTFGMLEDQERRKKQSMLDEVAKVVDFGRVEKLLEKMYRRGGRPPIPPLMLFKALLLESWYSLSDVEVVQEIHDRRSFERFIGADVRKHHLDDTTLVKFRQRLRATGTLDKVWAEVDRAFIERGLTVRKGVIVDSTLVEGACRPESKREDGSPVDSDAEYTSRNGRAVAGYKVHVGMDEGSGLVRRMELSRIRESDHEHFGELIPAGVERVYADKAYRSREHEKYLAGRGVKSRVLHTARRNRPLTAAQKRINRAWSRVRALIEPKMNDLKRWCSMGRMRYYGLERNDVWMFVCGLAANFKRAVVLESAT